MRENALLVETNFSIVAWYHSVKGCIKHVRNFILYIVHASK